MGKKNENEEAEKVKRMRSRYHTLREEQNKTKQKNGEDNN